ncbi:putative membrane protein YeiB [Streptosporangium becharense]|uniref:Putative membrane protein YeiB n=1 Tax=Streptosporangium becharense TaxID=1816182 RepID=A0A7W9IF29_9ACTN|nr:DUF418 domain-containing protein [Streptosporangium becharense]MBB2910097.1 putative membrane protein YeiB [Streptosporangium becharense]MBB5818948.1 putative membrane protein YeiB [Streptosporangium becharense]
MKRIVIFGGYGTESAVPAFRGPVEDGERALAPDLARGFMLLLIALANTPWYLWGRELRASTIHPPGGSAADRIVQIVGIVAVDFRVYPMFAFLFGYGMVQMISRQRAGGHPETAALALLRRRNLWLLLFGFAHAALLWQGDILGAYGLTGLLLGRLFLRRGDRVLLTWAAIGTGVLVLTALLGVAGACLAATAESPPRVAGYLPLGTASVAESDPITAALERLTFWPVVVVGQGLVGLALPVSVVLGFWAARHRIMERPGEHLPLLRRVAVAGVAIGWLGGLPHAAAVMGVLDVPEESMFVFGMSQTVTGLPAGLGYVAVFGLVGHRLGRRRRPGRVAATTVSGMASGMASAMTAVGRRSLSAYLAQSVLCAPVLAAWGLGLGARLHSASMAGYAAGVWTITVVAAVLLERRRHRGPAETLLRRLTYRR